MVMQKRKKRRNIAWKRVLAVAIVFWEFIAIITIFFAIRKDEKNQLLAVKQQVVETENLQSPEEIYVFRLKSEEYIYVLDGRNVSIDSDEIKEKIDTYIDFQTYRTCSMFLGIVLTIVVNIAAIEKMEKMID